MRWAARGSRRAILTVHDQDSQGTEGAQARFLLALAGLRRMQTHQGNKALVLFLLTLQTYYGFGVYL